MKGVIAAAKKRRENRRLLVMKNVNKTAMAKVAKISSIIDFGNKYSWVISNANIDAAGDLRLTSIKILEMC